MCFCMTTENLLMMGFVEWLDGMMDMLLDLDMGQGEHFSLSIVGASDILIFSSHASCKANMKVFSVKNA